MLRVRSDEATELPPTGTTVIQNGIGQSRPRGKCCYFLHRLSFPDPAPQIPP